MINMYEVSETNKMIEHENLDVVRSHLESACWTAWTPIWKN